MMRHLSIDIETYSSVSLRDAGVWGYSEAEDFEILLFAYAFDFGEVLVIDFTNGDTLPEEVTSALSNSEIVKTAYNAAFEITCLNRAGYKTSAEQWTCTMFHALYAGYPAGLAVTGKALGLPASLQKDSAGAALIRYFCVPCKPTRKNGGRTRNLPVHDPEKWALFKRYNAQDVVAEMEIAKRLAPVPVPETEQALWVLEQRYHAYGIPIDARLVSGALRLKEENNARLLARAKDLTGLDNPNSRNQMKEWVEDKLKRKLTNLTKAAVDALIDKDENPQVTEALKIRSELSRTSLAKYDTILATLALDGRVHGAHQIYGANRTGRWAGRLIQPQNLPRNSIPMLDLARKFVKEDNADALRLVYGPDLTDTLSQLLRTTIVASKGNKLISADFSAIEARVIAWLAGETWVNEVFAGHGKIYEATASQMFGVPIDRIKKGNPEYAYRQKGKVATLALGYQGGIGALKAMGALQMGIQEAELPEIVSKWRRANPHIVAFWADLQKAAQWTMVSGQESKASKVIFRSIENPETNQKSMTIELPSGRKLYYLNPRLEFNDFGEAVIHYSEARSGGLVDETTYGGKLAENITQAVARDCLALTIIRMSKKGWQIIMHIHDEVVIDALESLSVEEVCDVMSEPIPWAPGLVLKGSGFASEYYMKD